MSAWKGRHPVNGDLFAESLEFADFNRDMRKRLLVCCRFDWSRISPAIFGSLFQSVLEPRERRQVGAHYTSERDILKLVRSLFLDELRAEFERLKANKHQLKEFHARLGELKFLDPACGCGNFLVVTYRELRLLEIEILQVLLKKQQVIDIHALSRIDVDAMYGIEINEFPVRIAEVALWLVDHQMNQRLSEEFGQYFIRLPLKKSPTIRHANALRTDWNSVLPSGRCSFVMGNPPFVGGKYQTKVQRSDMGVVLAGVANAGLLDYVTAWYVKAAGYIQGTSIPVAFVSTSSISQGEQVGVLWRELFRRGMHIRFAHRTFSWASEARGKAHVHVVIIGFSERNTNGKRIYEYENDDANPTVLAVKNISPYLVAGPDTVVVNRGSPLCRVPQLAIGNKPIDDGNYLFTTEERNAFIRREPKSKQWFRPFVGADEFINGWQRWCLWLGECPASEVRQMRAVLKRVEAVRKFRLASKSEPTRRIAESPTRFHVENMPTKPYLLIPRVSSERRKYVPIGYVKPNVIASDACLLINAASRYHFGVLTSSMHMAWVRQVCGRLESRYRYSSKLVYNNFPWPEVATDKHQAVVETKAKAVLEARAAFPDCNLATLYDPVTMPPRLVKAHSELDRAVDKCYRAKPFRSDRERVEFLFGLYERLTSPLTASAPKP